MSEGGRGAEGGAPDRILVIGYGNSLRSDDGVGPRVAERLVDDARFTSVDVLARHQLTPELAMEMAGASLVVLVDADVDGTPGRVSVRRVDGTEAARSGPGSDAGASSHHVGVEELLALAAELGGHRPRAVIVSVGVATLELGEELSPEVDAALPEIVDAVARLVAAPRA